MFYDVKLPLENWRIKYNIVKSKVQLWGRNECNLFFFANYAAKCEIRIEIKHNQYPGLIFAIKKNNLESLLTNYE